ncbi:hypothetical protein CLIB1444_04S00606 [[Candida] jaroonii]|uniref:Uncharacterized protein n=1 Tax=[Candida] jaroonii TaxID=467808 RepID=A0ACA9Y6Y1_9ASCO|nr:hypothetical protein CLIB1444_04S00606 [[Candida] jaroonii]
MSYETPGEFPLNEEPETDFKTKTKEQEALNNTAFYFFAAIFLMILLAYGIIIIAPMLIGLINSVLFYYKGFGYIKTPLIKVLKKIHNKPDDLELHSE